MFKIKIKFRKCKKKWRKYFWFLRELPLLRKEYLSSAVKGLRNSPKILHITQGDFFDRNCLQRDQ